MVWRGVAALGIGVFLVAAPSAVGSTASVTNPGGKGTAFRYEAEPGEENRMVASGSGQIMTIRDTGAVITAGVGCEQLSQNKVRCDSDGVPRRLGPTFLSLIASLGDAADRAEIGPGVTSRVDAGGGADTLEGGGLPDSFDGGGGPDVLDGGASDDTAVYDRTQDVTVTLGDGDRNEGGPQDGPKRDLFKHIEQVAGGSGDDLLSGSSKVEGLFGYAGKDELRGGGAADLLSGGDGRDLLRGEGGGDALQGQEGDDRAFGGPGADEMQGGLSTEGADLLDGGGDPGDWISYSYGPVRIELDGNPNDGFCADVACTTSAENDNVKGVQVIGSFIGDDLLIGSSADEIIRPSLGADIVRARGGDDTIDLSPGDGPDDVSCGPGDDTVLDDELEDNLSSDCES